MAKLTARFSSTAFRHAPGEQDPRYSFFQHDCLEAFPPEHQGKYDLVSIRLIVMAMVSVAQGLCAVNL